MIVVLFTSEKEGNVLMGEHKTTDNNKGDKSHIFNYKHKRATKGHNFNLDQVEIQAIESIERPRRYIQVIHTKFTEATIRKTFDLPACYYRGCYKNMPRH